MNTSKNIFRMSILLILTITNLSAQVEFDETRETSKSFFNLYKLKCVVNLGSRLADADRDSTVLQDLHLTNRQFSSLSFDHDEAFAKGCDRAALDTLVDDSFTSFNHAEAEVTLIKRAAKAPRIYRGQCMRNIQEQVSLDFGSGIILKTPLLGKLVPATGC